MSGLTLSSSSGGPTTGVPKGAVEFTESSGRALKLQTDGPHLVSMGGDRLSTAVTLHPLPSGIITLGSSPKVDINVQGTGVLPVHCHIENVEGVVTIYPTSGQVCIDGVATAEPSRLTQGVILTIGRSNYMRFNHPAEAKLMKSVLPNSRISMAPFPFDNVMYLQKQSNKKPPVAPRRSPRESMSDEEPPSNIMTKVSKFEYLAAQNFRKSISPKVFSANLVTVNTPAKDVLGKAPPDLHNFAKNISQPAVNYSDSGFEEKQKNKTPDRQIFGCKSPAYVNVAINEGKSINNKVVLFENGSAPKPQNINHEQPHELNNITRNYNPSTTPTHKNTNVSHGLNKPHCRSVTPTSSGDRTDQQRLSGSLGDLTANNFESLAVRKNEAEIRRNQAQVDRIKEQEIEKAEQVRLEEILNMCAEYDKQVQCEKSMKPTPNRIKTNGSLPRDKRTCISPNLLSSPGGGSPLHSSSPSQSKDNTVFKFEVDKPNNHSYENVSINHNHQVYYETVEIRKHNIGEEGKNCMSTYENVSISNNGIPHFPQSPRTRIKTFVTTNKESPTKYELLDRNEQNRDLSNKHLDSTSNFKSKTLPPKFILAMKEEKDYILQLENYENLTLNNHSASLSNNLNVSQEIGSNDMIGRIDRDANVQKIQALRSDRKEKLNAITSLKRQMAEIESHGEELCRELELEKALIVGEYKSKELEIEKLELRKEQLMKRALRLDEKMNESQVIQEEDQKMCKEKLLDAQENLSTIELKLSILPKSTPDYDTTFDELLLAQEVLDTERKTFEDLEFHHLEEEADWLASREEIQREILELTKRIDELSHQINDLDKEKTVTTNVNAKEYKKIEEKRLDFSRKIEEIRNQIKIIDAELSALNNKESDDEVSTDSDSDKTKDTSEGRLLSDSSLNQISDLSCSYIISSTKLIEEDFNMSQSFNEKLFMDKSVLDDGLGKKIPSQDDIDRISKITIDAPINMVEDSRGSLGRKTIESLKEIERNRQLHLVQQGSQVIENERRRVLALKQKVQNEVRSKWAQRKQDCLSYNSTGSDETPNEIMENEQKLDASDATSGDLVCNKLSPSPTQARTESEEAESPRPLSETSDISVEVGTALTKRRNRADKLRPLTRYLPIRSSELDLKQHIESAGHQVNLCPHIIMNTTSCRGFLHKRGSKLNGWSRRWFVFDRIHRTLAYYADKNEKKVRGGAYFQAIEEVYLDHANTVKSPNPHLTFVVKTHERYYYLMAPSPEAMRIWIDVIFTGAEGYQEFDHGT
ncbi:PREDICTED: pleckstrin homology-like domain family B member 1 [Nicrophorus vespilloides]|uniref:Pleckstrin homology-like domain family B member 1 n=1 Tax=Nicrophorus vespilloides TaxID=110193 RepID=A0ABM1M6M7_NICVS|nr:PREDICTED: pleckstrin homology-like domain family B member 1 [Nicrophorus vespilloides]XP_017770228.1 PREDICTED: pleckstrin homology-like domain family B member 1 [Nicrophorus vespilloides]